MTYKTILFYGHFLSNSYNAWRTTHDKDVPGCVVRISGYDENVQYFLAAKESLHSVEEGYAVLIPSGELIVDPVWHSSLEAARKNFQLEVVSERPAWYMVMITPRDPDRR